MTPKMFILCTLLIASFAFNVHAETAALTRQWQVADETRQAIIMAPEVAKQSDSPVIFAFHGHGGTAKHAARSFGFQDHWPEAIVVYMQGLNTPGRLTDPDGKKTGWQSTAGDQGDRDLKFFDAVLATLKKEYKVDASRIYATGHSNGGGFTYLLWGQRGDVFAAVAPSASAASNRGYRDLKPKPALHVAGDNDPLVKYSWQQVAMQIVRDINGCEKSSVPWASEGEVVGREYRSPAGTPFVSLIHHGEHKFLPETSQLIVKFFQQHSSP